MRNHTGCARDFIQHSRSWYAEAAPLESGIEEEVMFGLTDSDGGTSGEMAMRWHKGIGPRLECWSDSWSALHTFSDVIARLAAFDTDLQRLELTPQLFCDLLLECGFTDATPTVKPGQAAAPGPG